jgi:WD40 repeat protein
MQAITALSFAPHNAHCLLTASDEGSIRLWDAESDHEVRYQHNTGVTAAVWSPDGTLVASSAQHDETLHLWDAHTGESGIRILLSISSTKQLEMISLAWSPDGKLLAVGCDDSTVQLIDLTSCQHVHTYRVNSQAHRQVKALAWSPDGTLLAAGSDGYYEGVLIWNVAQDLNQQASTHGDSALLAATPRS